MRQTPNNNRPSQPPPRRPPSARPAKQPILRSLFPPADRPGAASTLNARKPPSRPLTAVVVTRSPPILGPTTTTAAVSGARRNPRTAAATASAKPASTRAPLRACDRNAAWAVRPASSTPRVPPLPTSSSSSSVLSHRLSSAASDTRTPRPRQPRNPTMRSLKAASSPSTGYDKDTTPRKPTLASSRPVVARAPLTPKIASAASPRTPYTPGQGRDGVVLAAGPFISSNVTPRSGTRQHRVDSGSNTPTYGTPTQSQRDGRPGGLGGGGAGLSPAAALDERLHSVAAHAGSAAINNSADSKFFYASEAKPATSNSNSNSTAAPPPPPLPLAPPSRSSTFFYASGESLPSPQLQQQQQQQQPPTPLHASSSAGPSGSPPPDLLSSKFVHANGAALDRPHSLSLKGPGSVMSTQTVKRPPMSSRAPTTPGNATPYSSAQQRPLSPVKKAPISPYSSLQKRGSFPLTNNNAATRVPEAPTSTPNVQPVPSPGPASPGNGNGNSGRFDLLQRQRTSSSAGGHSRKGSLTIADPPTVARLLQSSQPSSETTSPAASVHFASPSYPFPSNNPGGESKPAAPTGLAAFLQQADELSEHEDDEDGSASHAGSNKQSDAEGPAQKDAADANPGSPPASSHVDELVANARRERKVQDLEIRNASLEAINRSLERQMRKQKAELRQFRRLSRSGRLSLAPSSASAAASRVTSGASTVYEGPLQDPNRLFSILDEDDSDDGLDGAGYDDGDDYASDMEVSFNDETAEKDGDDDDDDDNDNDNDDDSGSDNSRQQRRRKRDERRLQLDLTKHRQLLVDSQKINQSIRRCLGWTEALIQEGQKALAFQVRVSEVQLGGRVLAADELLGGGRVLAPPDDLEGDADVQSVVTESVVGEPNAGAGKVYHDESEQKSDVTLAEAIVPGAADGDDDDNRDEAFSPISQKSRSVHFDMDVQVGLVHERNKTAGTEKDAVQDKPLLETAPVAVTPSTLPDTTVRSDPAPEPVPVVALPEEPSAVLDPAPDSAPVASPITDAVTAEAAPEVAVELQNEPTQEKAEPMPAASVEGVAS